MTLGRSRRTREPDRGRTRIGTASQLLSDLAATAVVVALLVGINLASHLLPSPWWLGPLGAVALLAFARWRGRTWAELGLSRERLRSGCRWGLGAVAVVAGVYTVAVLLPVTRTGFLDSRYHLPLPDVLYTAFVLIPLGTVVLEEVAFRSVLWAMLARHSRPWQVLLTTSVLFGLWHVIPALHLGSANPGVAASVGGGGSALVVAATVALTAVGGLVFGELRRRSGSVLASAAAHWATNALGVLFGVLAWRLAG